ncbi:hypothetical protein ASD24_26990 [Paenibacillus sp. Root52]|uniref:hypothetical protein n=1 Tax=Paenibacillus sp. Root52 TaxID=1736552 RepID=UPI0006FFDB3E|nr:hypothetical protein [Paenibacillus sp. Root52]KQY86693.1 hypothetical protein ASD24_26990 [Paenibacillus sp. Root52]
MYSLATQLASRMRAIIEVENEIAAFKSKDVDDKAVLDLEQKRSELINSSTRDELFVIKTVMKVGRGERGYRFHAGSDEIEIIKLPIELNQHELMQKYSYYLVHKTESELANSIEFSTVVTEELREGMEILKL